MIIRVTSIKRRNKYSIYILLYSLFLVLFLGGCLAVSSNGFNENYKHKRWEIGAYAVYLLPFLNDEKINRRH